MHLKWGVYLASSIKQHCHVCRQSRYMCMSATVPSLRNPRPIMWPLGPCMYSYHAVLQSFNIAALAQIIYRLCVNCIRLEAVTCRAAELQKETDRRFRLLSVQCSVPLALHVALVVAIILTATQRLLTSLGALLTN